MTAPPPANSPPANLADSVIIIGAGIVGLATAYALSEAAPDLRITIVDKEAGPARHQTGHNSGVIHAGLYYQPGSLKADLCRKGALETVEFCQQHGIAHEVCGKLVVANTELEATRLDAIHERATANGVPTELLTGDEVREREPNIDVARALYSPRTGIVDYGGMCQQLVEILRERGADIRFNTAVEQLTETATGIHLVTDQGVFEASYLIACAGLQADRIAAFLGLNDDFRIVPFRGQYYRLPDRYDDYTKHLIYPVPDPELPFLGVHMTRMVGGFMTVGPNAMLSFGRETYGGNWPDVTDSATSFSFPGFWRMLAGNIAPAIYELKGAVSKRVYLKRCQEYCPSLKLEDLQPYPPGIRAQAVMRDGKLMDDFLIKRSARSIHVCNAPSPAATAAFPIGRHIAGLYQEATAA